MRHVCARCCRKSSGLQFSFPLVMPPAVAKFLGTPISLPKLLQDLLTGRLRGAVLPSLPALDLALQVNHSPDVVLLVAGASYAAAPNGDAHGRRSPLMNNLVATLDLGPRLDALGVAWRDRNFEDVYSELHARAPEAPELRELETRVRDYFAEVAEFERSPEQSDQAVSNSHSYSHTPRK